MSFMFKLCTESNFNVEVVVVYIGKQLHLLSNKFDK